MAVDDNSGREAYLLSRREAKVRVTELVAHLLRVADTSVATLDGTILRGRSPGSTEVQVCYKAKGYHFEAKLVTIFTSEHLILEQNMHESFLIENDLHYA